MVRDKKERFKKRSIAWSKGKTKENCDILKIAGEKSSKTKQIKFQDKNYKENYLRKNKGIFKKGRIPYTKGKTKENCEGLRVISELMMGNKIWDNPTSKNSQFKKGNIPWSKGLTKENCEGLRVISELMKNGGAMKARMSNRKRPNKPEKIIINLIQQNNLNLIYVGDSQKWFNGETQSFNPDFINENKKKIVELFGDYWHKIYDKKDVERLATYSKYGYKTLVIWEHELKNQHQVLNKIKTFIK